jgi:hypothetical protein
MKARATQTHRHLGSVKKMSINLKSTRKMVDETLSLEVPTIKKIVVKKQYKL